MANEKRTKLGQGDFNPIFSFKKAGDNISGIFKGTRFVEVAGSNIHTIETADGEFDLWGTGKLDYLLKDLPVKTKVEIKYLGQIEAKVKIGKKGKRTKKQIHDFEAYRIG